MIHKFRRVPAVALDNGGEQQPHQQAKIKIAFHTVFVLHQRLQLFHAAPDLCRCLRKQRVQLLQIRTLCQIIGQRFLVIDILLLQPVQKTAAPPVVDAVKQAVVCTDGAGQQLGGQVSDWIAALLVVALQEKAHGRKRMVDRATHGRGVSCGGQPQIQPVGLLELPHVVQQAGQRGEARQPYLPQCRGCIFRRFPAVCLRGLLPTVVRDMCKIFHTSPPNDFRIASGVSDKQDNYAQPVGNGRKPWKLRAVFQKDPADYII